MPVEDVLSPAGQSTIVTGHIESGKIQVGQQVELVGMHDTRSTTVNGVQIFRESHDSIIAQKDKRIEELEDRVSVEGIKKILNSDRLWHYPGP